MMYARTVSWFLARWTKRHDLQAARLRILIQGMNYQPERIGVGKYTTQLAEYLAARFHEVDVVTALPHYPGWRVASPHRWRWTVRREQGVRIVRCPLVARAGRPIWRLVAPLTFAITAAAPVLWRCLRTRPDVVLCIEPTLLAAPTALLAARLVGARTVIHVQDLEVDAAFATRHLNGRALRRFAHACERLLLRRFDAVVTISDAMADRLRRRGVLGDRLTVLRNWVTPPAAADVVADAGPPLPNPRDRRVALYAGNLGAKQGLSVLVDAARRLRADPDIHILVVGDGPMAPMMRAAAASLPNLTLVGVLPPDRLHALLASADCHVVPQDRAASDLVFPCKLGPIMASGRPVVVTSDCTREVARWVGAAAAVVPPGDARALAAALQEETRRSAPRDPARARDLAGSLEAETILARFERVLRPAARAPAPAARAVWAAAEAAAG